MPESPKQIRYAISKSHLTDETLCLNALLGSLSLSEAARQRIGEYAKSLVVAVRKDQHIMGGVGAFLKEYDLSSQEGVVLLCLAEALLRVPDSKTADRLIRDKLSTTNWESHLGSSDSLLVNAGTWGLMLTGRLVRFDKDRTQDMRSLLGTITSRLGEPVVRTALREAMRIMGFQFVMGRTIPEAIKRSTHRENRTFLYSYDMLGEAATTKTDAQRYYGLYRQAINTIGAAVEKNTPVYLAPGLSIKLSALHPRFEYLQKARVMEELVPVVKTLAGLAEQAGIGLTIDAEESECLDLTLDIFEAVYCRLEQPDWGGFGIAVQAYQKRAPLVIDWLIELAKQYRQTICVRLVKGAYWDAEIKRAQELGLKGFPVFTRKTHTDVSYLACAQRLLLANEVIFPQFATHNAHTIAAVLEMVQAGYRFEMQRLHGMGETLYGHVAAGLKQTVNCRVYAPVGQHKDLLPYLVRRLLENGANTSFVNRITDEQTPISDVIRDPVSQVENSSRSPHAAIKLPKDLFGEKRINSSGVEFTDDYQVETLERHLMQYDNRQWYAAPIFSGRTIDGIAVQKFNPANRQQLIGQVVETELSMIDSVIEASSRALQAWEFSGVEIRAKCLEVVADLYEAQSNELVAMCSREGGRCIADAVSELREAIDFCRYYAATARDLMVLPQQLPGPTGERNELSLHGRGVFICISPWNFPLAIFTGQIAAALVAGNCVIANPASSTSLLAYRAVQLFHQAGIPPDVLQFTPGSGSKIGASLVADLRIAGVAFTGSIETAKIINKSLARHDGPIVPLIAETGGQNAMIVDSSALPEQVVADVVRSAFNSAGQRCSALRVLFVQDDIAVPVIELLKGAMAELTIGDPGSLSTDIGPVIDSDAQETLRQHIDRLSKTSKLIYQTSVDKRLDCGNYIGPCAFELAEMALPQQEVFGPVLRVVRYDNQSLDKVIAAINNSRFGLTLGIHTRIGATADYIQKHIHVGNIYVNRNMIGAVVGAQPFGGEGLSGTGPKAGGPNYLYRFTTERVSSTNTTAVGGNASLLMLDDDSRESHYEALGNK